GPAALGVNLLAGAYKTLTGSMIGAGLATSSATAALKLGKVAAISLGGYLGVELARSIIACTRAMEDFNNHITRSQVLSNRAISGMDRHFRMLLEDAEALGD